MPQDALQIAMIYARVPKMQCQGKCQQCCGPITYSEAEAQRLGVIQFDPETLTCEKLSADGRCSIYAQRPLICRLWGTVPSMACPHGCTPVRWLTEAEANRLVGEMERL
jgi:Fe-S-cluster containining protein